MNSTKNEKKKNKAILFPCLMTTKNGCVVLFTNYRFGTVVNVGMDGNKYTLGEYHDTWEMTMFDEYNGEVTLSN